LDKLNGRAGQRVSQKLLAFWEAATIIFLADTNGSGLD